MTAVMKMINAPKLINGVENVNWHAAPSTYTGCFWLDSLTAKLSLLSITEAVVANGVENLPWASVIDYNQL